MGVLAFLIALVCYRRRRRIGREEEDDKKDNIPSKIKEGLVEEKLWSAPSMSPDPVGTWIEKLPSVLLDRLEVEEVPEQEKEKEFNGVLELECLGAGDCLECRHLARVGVSSPLPYLPGPHPSIFSTFWHQTEHHELHEPS